MNTHSYFQLIPPELRWAIEKFRITGEARQALMRELLETVQPAELCPKDPSAYYCLVHKKKWVWEKAQVYRHRVFWAHAPNSEFYPETSVLSSESHNYEDLTNTWYLKSTYHTHWIGSFRNSVYIFHERQPSSPPCDWRYKMWPDDFRVPHSG